jgi:hypothetical protein
MLKQFLTLDVKRILLFDLNRILMWDVGRAFTRPIRHPLLKVAGGWLVGVMVIGLGSMMIGIWPSDQVVNLLALGVGIVWALAPEGPSIRGTDKTEGPVEG